MKPEAAAEACRDETMQEVRRLKEENAAEYGFDVEAIAAAARKHQDAHPHRVVSRPVDEGSEAEDDKRM